MKKEIAKKPLTEYRQADKIIQYLINPLLKTELTAAEQRNLNLCKEVHALRMNYTRKKDIAAVLSDLHGIKERQAYNLINLTEQIFGKVEGVHKDYERNFLLECSRKNIEIAMKSRNSMSISKALTAHYKISGLDEFIPDMPDFAALEQHKYIVNLPISVIEYIKKMITESRSLKLSDFIPPPNINLDNTQEAEIIS